MFACLRRKSNSNEMQKLLFIYILIMCSLCANAQTDRQEIRKGNRLFRQQQFDKSEVNYRKAASLNQKNPQALYNLGCALMQQQKDSAAIVQFEAAGKLETNKLRKAKVYHNIGVVCQNHQMYGEAIEAYKESLRNNPKDMETRYNLALCQRQKKNQDKNNNNQDKQNQDKDKNGQDQKKDQNQQDDKKDQQKQDKPKEQMSKDNAEQLLQAAMQQEKNTQQKMKKQQAQPRDRRLQKNW